MSDQKGSGGFGGPKKPKATFGDAMLGIPSGSRDDRDRGGGGRGKGGDRKGPRGDRGPGDRGAKPGGAQAAAPAPKREEKKGGPMVVVRRAGGAVETRKLDADQPAAEPVAAAAEPAAGSCTRVPARRLPTVPRNTMVPGSRPPAISIAGSGRAPAPKAASPCWPVTTGRSTATPADPATT